MKINILINSGYSFFSLRKSLVMYLLKKNYIRVLTPNNVKNIKKKLNYKNLKVEKFKFFDDKSSLIHLLNNFINLKTKFINNENDTNIIFGSYLNLIYGLLSSFIKSKKNVYVFTGLGSYFNSDKKISIYILRFFFNFIISKKNSIFIFYNTADRNFLIRNKFYTKCKIIPGSGVKLNNKIKIQKKINKIVKFLYYSRFNYDKGISDLLKAIQIVNHKGYSKMCKFYFYGLFDDNPTNFSKSKLIRFISKNKNCFFSETNYSSNLSEIFRNKDIFILPSHREGLPKTALEAMNYEKTLLLSKIPGHNLLIDKKELNGLFFKKKNYKDLANKMIWIMKNKAKIRMFSKNSKKNLIKFSDEIINKKYYEAIK